MFNFVKIEQNFQIFQRLKCAKVLRESNYETKKSMFRQNRQCEPILLDI